METNPIRVCELLVGLGDVNVLGVDDGDPAEPLRAHVETRGPKAALWRLRLIWRAAGPTEPKSSDAAS